MIMSIMLDRISFTLVLQKCLRKNCLKSSFGWFALILPLTLILIRAQTFPYSRIMKCAQTLYSRLSPNAHLCNMDAPLLRHFPLFWENALIFSTLSIHIKWFTEINEATIMMKENARYRTSQIWTTDTKS